MKTLETLETTLSKAVQLLDSAADQIRTAGLSPEKNVQKISEALILAFQIQNEIYTRRPDLQPKFVGPKSYNFGKPRKTAQNA